MLTVDLLSAQQVNLANLVAKVLVVLKDPLGPQDSPVAPAPLDLKVLAVLAALLVCLVSPVPQD